MNRHAAEIAARLSTVRRAGDLPDPEPAQADEGDGAVDAVRLLIESLTAGQLARLARTDGADGRAPTLVPRYVMHALVESLGETYLDTLTED